MWLKMETDAAALESCEQDQTLLSRANSPALPSTEAGRQKVFERFVFAHPEGCLIPDSS